MYSLPNKLALLQAAFLKTAAEDAADGPDTRASTALQLLGLGGLGLGGGLGGLQGAHHLLVNRGGAPRWLETLARTTAMGLPGEMAPLSAFQTNYPRLMQRLGNPLNPTEVRAILRGNLLRRYALPALLALAGAGTFGLGRALRPDTESA